MLPGAVGTVGGAVAMQCVAAPGARMTGMPATDRPSAPRRSSAIGAPVGEPGLVGPAATQLPTRAPTTSASSSPIARYNADAFAEAYRRHAGAVFALALRLLWERMLAEEMVQEIFLRLWEHPDRFDQAAGRCARSCSWTRTRAVSTASARIRGGRSAKSARARAEVVADYDLDLEAYDLGIAEQVREALATLSDGERRAIELAYFGGHTYREVARILEQPEGTIKSRIRTGLDPAADAAGRPGNRRVMDRELTPDEIAELLPAYALDAVDDDERAVIEAYLAARPRRARQRRRAPGRGVDARPRGRPAARRCLGTARSRSSRPPRRRAGRAPAGRAVPPQRAGAAIAHDPIGAWRWLAAAAAVVALAFVALWLVDRGGDGGGRPPTALRGADGRHLARRAACRAHATPTATRSRPRSSCPTAPATSRRSSRRPPTTDVPALGYHAHRGRSRSA